MGTSCLLSPCLWVICEAITIVVMRSLVEGRYTYLCQHAGKPAHCMSARVHFGCPIKRTRFIHWVTEVHLPTPRCSRRKLVGSNAFDFANNILAERGGGLALSLCA